MKATQFLNREEAGRKLAAHISSSIEADDKPVVLALPRGGVPVAFEVAGQLNSPLDVLVVRSLGFPGNEGFTVGALAEGGQQVLSSKMLQHVPSNQWNQVIAKEQLEMERSIDTYRGGQELPGLRGKTVVLVDESLSLSATILAALKAIRKQRPRRIIVAAPVGERNTCQEILGVVNEVVCLRIPDPFIEANTWYQHYPHPSDEVILSLLSQARSKFGEIFH